MFYNIKILATTYTNINYIKSIFFYVINSFYSLHIIIFFQMYSQDLSSIVIDVGNLSTRAGYSGEDTPRYIIPSFLGMSKSKMIQQNSHKKSNHYIGDSKLNLKRQDLQIFQVSSGGKIINYDHYEDLLIGLLQQEMRCEYKQYSLLLSQDNIHNKQQREKIAQIIYEKFDIKNLFFSKNAVLSCFATGRSTGLVFDTGAQISSATTIHEGFALSRTIRRSEYAGEAFTKLIQQHIKNDLKLEITHRNWNSQKNYEPSYNTYHTNCLLRDIKQTVFKIDQNSQQNPTTVEYQLPDKKIIKIQKSRIPDPFFSTFNNDINYRGLQHLINQNINQCDIDIKKQLYNNIIVTGGNSLLGGFISKLQSKLSEITPPNAKLKLISFPFPSQRKFSSWIGGSILTSLSSFQSFWVGKQQWNQFGKAIIQRKCS